MVKYQYDYVVIGGGSAGLTSASFAADLKVSTLLIENNKIGGDCTWSGCVPSKALIHAAHEANIRGKTADYKEVHQFVKKKIEDVYALETPEVWKNRGVNILLGDAEIIDEHTLKVVTKEGEETVTCKKICIASGAHPIKNDKIKGLWDDEYKEKVYTYLEFWHKDTLPKTMALIGAGPIGAEIAQACSRFGCKVTIIASELLPREAESARKILTRVFKEEGIEHIPSRAASVAKDSKTGLLEVQTSDGQSVIVEEILVAVGRTPVLPKGADKFFKIGKTGGIVTNKYLKCVLKGSEKTSSSVVAAGDCIDGNLQFTHYAGKQGYYCARNSFLVGKSAGLIPLEVPRATYTSPEIASIGFTSVEEAKAAGKKNAMMLTSHGDHIDRSVTDDAQDNTLFEVILSDGGIGAKIIGANIIGPNAGEVLAPLCLAIKAKVPIKEFADVIQPYPTYSFGLMQMLGVEVTKRFKDSKTAAFAKAVNF